MKAQTRTRTIPKTSFFAAFSVGAVLFSAHAGGGFATGNQANTYYVGLGWAGIVSAIVAMLLLTLTMREAMIMYNSRGLTSYKQLFETLYHPFDKIEWLFEIFFYIMVLMAVAAAISGAASALRSYFGVNYYLGVVAVGCLVLLLTIFGAGIVRAASTYMGIAILVTAITIYAIGIFKSESPLFTVLSADFRTTGFANVPKAIFNAFTYAGFQCVTLPTMIACGTTMRSKQGCAKAMWISFFMNAVALVLSVFMLICWRGVYTAVDGGTTIPTLTVCNSMGIRALTAVYGVCLMLCLISTGVTTIFGFVARFEKLPMFRSIQSAPVRSAIVSAFIIILSMSISMAGLTNIIKYGYGYCGYLGIAVVVVPSLTVGVYKNRKYIREHGYEKGFAAAQPETEAAGDRSGRSRGVRRHPRRGKITKKSPRSRVSAAGRTFHVWFSLCCRFPFDRIEHGQQLVALVREPVSAWIGPGDDAAVFALKAEKRPVFVAVIIPGGDAVSGERQGLFLQPCAAHAEAVRPIELHAAVRAAVRPDLHAEAGFRVVERPFGADFILPAVRHLHAQRSGSSGCDHGFSGRRC